MNFKLKSLIYLFAFILSALLYYQMEEGPQEAAQKHLPELSMQQTDTGDTQNPAL